MTTPAEFNPFDSAARQFPAFAAALKHHETGDLTGARKAYLELTDRPLLTALCLHQLGVIAAVKREHVKAGHLFRQAITLEPNLSQGYLNLSAALDQQGNAPQATAVLVDLGCSLDMRLGRCDLAVPIYRRVLERDPLNYAAHINLGTVLARMGDLPAAAGLLLKGMALYGRLFSQVASMTLELLSRLDEKIAGVAAANVPPPGLPNGSIEKIEDALTTLGKVLSELGHSEEGLLCTRWSVALAPGYALGHWNLALALLAQGNYQEGWEEYEWRWRWPDFPEPRRLLPAAPWQGEALAGKRILVWAEQGQGDTIQFSPLLHRLVSEAAEVILEVPPSLVRLLAHAYPNIKVISRPDNPHQVLLESLPDFTVPLMSLPARLGLIPEMLPLATNYISPLAADEVVWQTRIQDSSKLNIGVVWAGRPAYSADAKRSMGFANLQPLFDIATVNWYSLQVGLSQGDPSKAGVDVVELHPYLNDFADTAAAIARLDLVITVDTATAHLTGAMGKQIWLLLPHVPEWRWYNNKIALCWYPGLRIFRQKAIGDWVGLIKEVRAEIEVRAQQQ